jgi:hypothetical protein
MKLKWAHFIKDELFFFFSWSTMQFSDKAFSNKCGGRLSVELVERVGIFLGRPPFWLGASGLQASLVGDGQHGVLLQNTWCSGTSYGGIDLYTLMAPHGPR